jgi:hypothetical protein
MPSCLQTNGVRSRKASRFPRLGAECFHEGRVNAWRCPLRTTDIPGLLGPITTPGRSIGNYGFLSTSSSAASIIAAEEMIAAYHQRADTAQHWEIVAVGNNSAAHSTSVPRRSGSHDIGRHRLSAGMPEAHHLGGLATRHGSRLRPRARSDVTTVSTTGRTRRRGQPRFRCPCPVPAGATVHTAADGPGYTMIQSSP